MVHFKIISVNLSLKSIQIHNATLNSRYLTFLRKNRDEENELMKNVPGWETGKLNGEPVYHNLNGRFPVVHPEAYFAHTSRKDAEDRYFEHRRH